MKLNLLSICVTIALMGTVSLSKIVVAQTDINLQPINYETAEVMDAVAILSKQVSDGETDLTYETDQGYLKSLLNELKIPVSSQTLVFSKTSLQISKISPRRPRAIYFNDDVYVGWCQKADVIEIAATDPNQGPTFYTLSQKEMGKPKFIRDNGRCLSCHQSNRTQNVPGYFVRSVFVDRLGHGDFSRGLHNTTISSPFSERWGGWYVTGKHGNLSHMGNTIFDRDEPSKEKESLEQGQNIESIDQFTNTKKYLTPHSDIVALMVLEHQIQMHNAITFANFETRRALHQSYEMNKILDRPKDFVSDTAKRRIDAAADRVVEHLLMCDEFPLTNPVSGTSDFTAEFNNRGPTDSAGRSLRTLELKTRLFRYPMSYLIYSDSFDGLPPEVRLPIAARLKSVLDGPNDSEKYRHLTASDRQSIIEILQETKPGLLEQP